MPLKKFVITRDLPRVDKFSDDQLKEASQTSNKALADLGGEVQWVNSFVVADKTYCVYLAKVRQYLVCRLQHIRRLRLPQAGFAAEFHENVKVGIDMILQAHIQVHTCMVINLLRRY
jgi:hypothetical protein